MTDENTGGKAVSLDGLKAVLDSMPIITTGTATSTGAANTQTATYEGTQDVYVNIGDIPKDKTKFYAIVESYDSKYVWAEIASVNPLANEASDSYYADKIRIKLHYKIMANVATTNLQYVYINWVAITERK